MATAKLLQAPQVTSIVGSTIRIAHPDISKNPRTSLGAPIAAAGTAMTVLDNNKFIDDDWFIVGDVGAQETEECDVNGAVTRGTALTVTNTLKFDHETTRPVNKILERGVKIYGAATDGGAGTLIASVDAITAVPNQLADTVMIQWNRPYTEYTLISSDTTYAYYFVKFTDGTTDSSASNYVLAAGLDTGSVMYMVEEALHLTSSELDDSNITLPRCIKWANDAQLAVTQFMYQDSRTGMYLHKDWDFELVDSSVVTVDTNENEFSLSSLGMKYPNDRAVISVRLGRKGQLKKVTTQEMDKKYEDKARTELSVQALAADIILTVDSNVEFEDSGSLYIGDEIITYTGKSGTTGFTGVPASGTGSIASTHAVDSPVWQGVQPGLPTEYAIFNNTLTTSLPIEADYDNYPLRIKYFKALTPLTTADSATEVTFTNILPLFIAAKIEQRKGNTEQSSYYLQQFEKGVLTNAIGDQIPTLDAEEYYKFSSL